MGSTTTQTTIANRALQLLGSPQISSLQENSRGARAINRAYQPVLLSELRKNYWSFAIRRASLAQNAIGPAFGKSFYYPLPPDYLDLAPPDMNDGSGPGGTLSSSPIITGSPSIDWLVEGGQIASNQSPPLLLRYVSSNVTESMFDPCFEEALAAALALNTCEEITQSNSKLAAAGAIYERAIEEAKKRNAFEGRPVKPPADSFITVRF